MVRLCHNGKYWGNTGETKGKYKGEIGEMQGENR